MNGLMKWRNRNTPEHRRDPFDVLQNEINRLFDRDPMDFGREPALFDEGFAPAIDVSETDNNVEIRCDLPGVRKDDIDISVSGNLLTIKGEKQDEKEEKESTYYRRESWNGSFQRTVSLPESVDADKAKAEMRDGILHLTMPKREEEKRKQIKVDVK